MSRLHFLGFESLLQSLYPFTLLRAVEEIPIGLLTIQEKWSHLLSAGRSASIQKQFTLATGVIPHASLAKGIIGLKPGHSLFSADGVWLATAGVMDRIPLKSVSGDVVRQGPVDAVCYPWNLLDHLEAGIQLDHSILTKGKRSESLPKWVQRIGSHPIFLSKGARIHPCILNASNGPIYIGPDAEVQEGAMIRGPFLLGGRSVVKMGAKIYGPVAVGESCLIGGEVKRSLLFAFTNKAHDGYMGDSVIGSWCNWGAGTSNSNLKNTAGEIEIWVDGKRVSAGQKAGVFMGDHSRTVINASINSGTLIGVSVQVGNAGLSDKRIPSFTWLDGRRYQFKKALEHINNWKMLKGDRLTENDTNRLKWIYKTDK